MRFHLYVAGPNGRPLRIECDEIGLHVAMRRQHVLAVCVVAGVSVQ